MAKISNSAYEYYMATYANNEVSRYDSHKKSDLRKVYNRIVKTNKESPLYKISNLEDAKKFAIDIKEGAKNMQNVVASLSDNYGSFNDSFQKKVAESSDNSKVSVKYVGDGQEENNTDRFDILINKLAAPQINTGNFLKNDGVSLLPGAYSFDLNTNTSAYEFQYSVNLGETNKDILNKLAGLVNNSNLGIDASLIEDGEGSSALSLTSRQTGLSESEDYLFSITPTSQSGSSEAMRILGINNVSQEASNSDFLLNGTQHSSLSNTFTINNAFELKLKDVTPDEPTSIGFKASSDAVADNIQSLVDVYNNILTSAKQYSQSIASAGNKFFNDMSSVSLTHRASLNSAGLIVGDDGSISIDKDILADALSPERAQDTFDTLSDFKNSIGEKADNVAINPMNYVNKVVVAYKNPGKNFNTPYISSIYSGMMLDKYL